MKLLSPAGDFDSLRMAVYNGADEVYLGVKDFNARNIEGFTLETLKEAVDFAHLYGVKVLLAINILFSDSELVCALNTAVKAVNLGVDALIVQDLGLIKLLSSNYPTIELHASTQMGIHNLEGVKALEKYNIKRVVLARETPLEEIKRIREATDIQLEYFCQGALCVSFSGNCYLSSYTNGNSGNRGKCKQLCRLPFSLEKNGKELKKGYLLSAKDFNFSQRLNQLIDAGIDVIKIEGRARRPFYVATATKEYYKALHGQKAVQDNLKLAFNRTYTAGYFDGNKNIISKLQNHIGIEVGLVEKVNLGKKFNQIYFSSSRDLCEKSVLKFIGKGETTISAYDLTKTKGNGFMVTTTKKVEVGDKVHLIVDEALENKILSQVIKKQIEVSVNACPNMQIKARVGIDGENFEVYGAKCLTAHTYPLTEEEIKQNFSKSQYFEAKVSASCEKAFLPKKELNEFRRKVFETAFNKIVSRYKKNLSLYDKTINAKVLPFNDFAFVEDINFSVSQSNVVFTPQTYTLEGVTDFINACKKQGKKAFLDLPNFALESDIKILKNIIEKTKIAIVANNYYALSFDTEIVIGGGLNVYNSLAAQEFSRAIITAESDISNKIRFAFMTLRHCPMKEHLSSTCDNCAYVDGYAYRMDNGKVLRLKRKKLSTCTFYLVD